MNDQFESILDYTVCLHSYVNALFMERIFREMGIMFKNMSILWCNCCDVPLFLFFLEYTFL